jgi:hypothetical protein
MTSPTGIPSSANPAGTVIAGGRMPHSPRSPEHPFDGQMKQAVDVTVPAFIAAASSGIVFSTTSNGTAGAGLCASPAVAKSHSMATAVEVATAYPIGDFMGAEYAARESSRRVRMQTPRPEII